MRKGLYTQAIKAYLKEQPKSRKLLKYGKAFGVEDKIRTCMEYLLWNSYAVENSYADKLTFSYVLETTQQLAAALNLG